MLQRYWRRDNFQNRLAPMIFFHQTAVVYGISDKIRINERQHRRHSRGFLAFSFFHNPRKVTHARTRQGGSPEANCGDNPWVSRRPNYRLRALRFSGFPTPHPSREGSSGRVPTSLKLMFIIVNMMNVNNYQYQY